MKLFTIPADFRKSTLEIYEEFNDKYPMAKIVETYGQMVEGKLTQSGRMCESLPQVGIKELEDYVAYSQKKGMGFNYTFNASCISNYEGTTKGIQEIKTLIKTLWNIGINTFTVALPEIMELIKYTLPQSKIVVSTICEVNSIQKIYLYKNLGVDRIVVDADINRDLKLLKRMAEIFGNGIEVIANNLCYQNCGYKMFHYNHDSHYINEKNGGAYYSSRCAIQKYSKKENVLKLNWIRPEDIHLYEMAGIRYFKLQGRPSVLNGNPWKAIQAYSEENYEGNLCDVLMLFSPSPYATIIDNKKLDGFLEGFCTNTSVQNFDCPKCSHCLSYAEKSVTESTYNKTLVEMFKNIDIFGDV
ncbi:MAG: U32 family peptidase [Hungatella sp.]|jgi:collagenase-like PrtC family protease|nr:U32 family peptidase [Hungatella sp.]